MKVNIELIKGIEELLEGFEELGVTIDYFDQDEEDSNYITVGIIFEGYNIKREFELKVRISDGVIEIDYYDDTYEELNNKDIWRHLFIKCICDE